jgi:Icc protein
MKLAWLTDIHQDHLKPYAHGQFLDLLEQADVDAFLVTGDISVANKLEGHLAVIAQRIKVPFYFVCGNHDMWYGSIDGVRSMTRGLESRYQHMVHLVHRSYVKLTDTCALVGHDGWYDAVNGDWKLGAFEMPDWYFIQDFMDAGCAQQLARGRYHIDYPRVVGKARALAMQSVDHIERGIKDAVNDGFKRIIVATHVPPFEEAHIHEGKQGTQAAQPWFTSGLLGDALVTASLTYPNHVFVSFSGHTHGQYTGQKAHNLVVHVGGARYGYPHIQTIIEV